MTTVTASTVSSDELKRLDSVHDSFPSGPIKDALGALSTDLHRGENVLFFPEGGTVTPSEAAKALGLSRTHLYKILESGALPFYVVGARDKRIAVIDLLEYRIRLHSSQKKTASVFASGDATDDAALDEMGLAD